MNDAITHLQICLEAKKNGIDGKILEGYSEETLTTFLAEAGRTGLGKKLNYLRTDAARRLVEHPGFIRLYCQLYETETEKGKLGSFLEDMAEEDFEKADFESVREVLTDSHIWYGCEYDYWAYFRRDGADEKQKENVSAGIQFYHDRAKESVGRLLPEERQMLYHPLFGQRLSDGMKDVRRILKELQNNAFQNLIAKLSIWSGGCLVLDDESISRLVEAPDRIAGALSLVMEKIPEDKRISLLELWLKNANLLYDAKRLAELAAKTDKESLCKIVESRVDYLGFLYGHDLQGIHLADIGRSKEQILLYAITHKKRHFLALVRQEADMFHTLPEKSILFRKEFYEKYVNLNTLNARDLKECALLRKMPENAESLLANREYSFPEMKILAGRDAAYVMLYHCLQYPRVDDRLRVFREITAKECLPWNMEDTEAARLGRWLSKAALSSYMERDFAMIDGLKADLAVKLLIHREELERFLPDVETAGQVSCLLANLDILPSFQNWEEFRNHLLKNGGTWLKMKEDFQLTDSFAEENQERILNFLCEGGAEIIMAFYQDQRDDMEKLRRLITAEFLGRFRELKYHEDDLSLEIGYPVSEQQKEIWMRNERKAFCDGMELWEEDRLLPVMQIGELPEKTCLSYRNGAYKSCLLSCFDANKKVLFASRHGRMIFRAILRLTKGSEEYFGKNAKDMLPDIEFADLLETKKKESRLTLFLERPYYSGISDETLCVLAREAIRLAEEKARQMGAALVLGPDYKKWAAQLDGYARCGYSIYISKSKNGRQYLDSLGGENRVSNSGTFFRGNFFVKNKDVG